MKVVTILKSNLAITHEQGEKVRDRIIKKLYCGKKATVDCGGLVCMTTDFISPISDLVLLYPKNILNRNIRFINISRYNAGLLRHSIDNALKFKENENDRPL